MTQEQALTILKTGVNVFLTGEPGSGKTYTINQYIHWAREHGLEVAITASTGIAATHIHGMTIHSWSGIGIKSYLSRGELAKITGSDQVGKRIRRAHILVIDEISMLPATTLDLVERVCREARMNDQPFGGLQVIFVGDFFQLPPIVRQAVNHNPQDSFFDDMAQPIFAYDASSWKKSSAMTCYLSEQHRQEDPVFLDLLSAIRSNQVTSTHHDILTQRILDNATSGKNITKLYSHNADVDRINLTELDRLPEQSRVFSMTAVGQENLIVSLKKGCLSPEKLELKIGATVMCTKNNQKDGYVNGTLATISIFDKTSGNPIILTKSGKRIEIKPATWAVEDGGLVKAAISQIPLRLAWAITVHKSQGMSLDAAIMDLADSFAYGQGYVALSRVRTLTGLRLLGYNQRALQVHPEILEKDTEFRHGSDTTIATMAQMSSEELEGLSHDFIARAGGSIAKIAIDDLVPLQAKSKKDTTGETLVLWNQGKNITEIAKIRELKQDTILSHIEKLLKNQKISIGSPAQVLTPKVLSGLHEIKHAFADLETDKLGPVYEELDGKYTYDELKLAKLVILSSSVKNSGKLV
ncbi:MAG: helix-turn-helix domain-containing protein [Patescibacteria group bacterium]